MQETEVIKIEVLQPNAKHSHPLQLNELEIIGSLDLSDNREFRLSLELWGEKIETVGVFGRIATPKLLATLLAEHFGNKPEHTVIMQDCKVSICTPTNTRIICVWW